MCLTWFTSHCAINQGWMNTITDQILSSLQQENVLTLKGTGVHCVCMCIYVCVCVCVCADTQTWYDLALFEGLHETVHLLLCEKQVDVVLQKRRSV